MSERHSRKRVRFSNVDELAPAGPDLNAGSVLPEAKEGTAPSSALLK